MPQHEGKSPAVLGVQALPTETTSLSLFREDTVVVKMLNRYPKTVLGLDLDNMDSPFSDIHRQSLQPILQRKSEQRLNQHKFYVTLVYDESTGKLSKQSSDNMKPFKNDILHEAVEKFTSLLRSQFALHRRESGIEDELEATEDSGKRSRSDTARQEVIEDDVVRPNKARKVQPKPDFDSDDDQDDGDMDAPQPMVTAKMSEKGFWEKWFNVAFRAVQQVSCRIIAKEWIKLIHPKKQSTHPYNGKDPKTGVRGDSSSTRPRYWPKDVKHREPDHINKEERVKLLVHLLMNTPHKEMVPSGQSRVGKSFKAEALKDALDQKVVDRAESELNKKRAIIEMIIHVRTQLELFEDDGYEPDAELTVPDYSDLIRNPKHKSDSDEPEDALTVPDGHDADVEDDVIEVEPVQKAARASDGEIQSFSKLSTAAKSEPKPRKPRRKRLIPESHPRHLAATSQEPTNEWLHKSFLQSKGVHPPMVLGEPDRYFPHHESMKLPERLLLSRDHNIEGQFHSPYPPGDWQLMNGQINMSEAYNNACASNVGGMSNTNQNAFIDGPYGMMPAPPYDRPVQYYPRGPDDGMPYPYMHQPPEDVMHAYFADVR